MQTISHIAKGAIVRLLTLEAKLVLKKYKPRIITVTGSVGKTSTKDAIYSALAGNVPIRKSEKSFNSEIGVPLTILGLPNAWKSTFGWLRNLAEGLLLISFPHDFPAWLVLEVGADHPGDIEQVTKWLKPDVAVFTRFARVPVHIEFFKSREHVISEKSHLADALKKDGVLVINHDDPDMPMLRQKHSGRVISFGFGEGADVRGLSSSVFYEDCNGISAPAGMHCAFSYGGKEYSVRLVGSLGRQHIYSLLVAVAVGLSQDIPIEKLVAGLEKHIPPRGRMSIVPGLKDTVVIDDTYNASPVATEEALALLASLKTGGRRIAVLADMMELGKHSATAHKEVGVIAGRSADVVMAVGVRARNIAQSALDILGDKRVFQFDTNTEAAAFLQNYLEKGDVVLVKGSQSMRMEKVVKEIMAEPEKAAEMLVRQEGEWERR